MYHICVCVPERERAAKTRGVQRWRQLFSNVLCRAVYSNAWLICTLPLLSACSETYVCVFQQQIEFLFFLWLSCHTECVCELNTHLVIQQKLHYCLLWSEREMGGCVCVCVKACCSESIYCPTFSMNLFLDSSLVNKEWVL